MVQYGKLSVHYPDKVFAIGDVHNEGDKLENLLEKIIPHVGPNDHIVFAGDLFNRGSQPAYMIQVLTDLVKQFPNQVFFVEGNHDCMLRGFLQHGDEAWFRYLEPTLRMLAYDWKLPDIEQETILKALIEHQFDLITQRMVPYYESEEVIVTHAPLDPTVCRMHGIAHYEEDYNDRLNNPGFTYFLDRILYDIKWTFTGEDPNFSEIPGMKKFHIAGHQPAHHKMPRIYKHRAFIDTGCGKGKKPVTCICYPGKQFWQGINEDDETK